jgi:hypothetical protein
MTTDIGLALVIRSVTETSLNNDKALLQLCETLVQRVTEMSERIVGLESHVNDLIDKNHELATRLQEHIETGE